MPGFAPQTTKIFWSSPASSSRRKYAKSGVKSRKPTRANGRNETTRKIGFVSSRKNSVKRPRGIGNHERMMRRKRQKIRRFNSQFTKIAIKSIGVFIDSAQKADWKRAECDNSHDPDRRAR